MWEELYRSGLPPEAQEKLRSIATISVEGNRLFRSLLSWINVYLLLPWKVALVLRPKQRFRLVRVLGHELFQFPEREMPVPVVYLDRQKAAQIHAVGIGQSVGGFAGFDTAFVVTDPDVAVMKEVRAEELSHVWDDLKFDLMDSRSEPADLNELLARVQLRSEGRLASHFRQADRFFAKGDSLGPEIHILAEVRQFLRRLLGSQPRKIWREELRNLSAPLILEAMVPGFYGNRDVGGEMVRELLEEKGASDGTSSDAFREMVREIWTAEFGPADPIEVPAARIFPATEEEAADQLARLSEAASREAFPGAGLEEKGTPAAGLKALLEYVAQEDVIRTIALLAESGKTGDVTEDFPALEGLAKEAGFAEGVAAILRTVAPGDAVIGVPAEYAVQGIPIFVKKEWEDRVGQNLSKLEVTGRIRFVGSAADAFLVIGDDSVSARPDQVFIGINEETVSRVTPHLLQELQIGGLLKAGSVVLLYKPLKESVLIFA